MKSEVSLEFPKYKLKSLLTTSIIPKGTKLSSHFVSWSSAFFATFPLDFPARDKFPTFTLALQSIEILKEFGFLSDSRLTSTRLSKIASVSGSFFRGLIFKVFLKYNLIC